MTDQEFSRICRLAKVKYGIELENKREIVNGRLENMIRREGWQSYSEYMNALETDKSGRMEKEFVNLLTTNHTFFMREFEHFEFIKKEVLPWLERTEARNKDLRIWCAASSTGEEPYTMAMLLKEYFGLEHANWDTKVLATDLSTEVLQTAVKGIYKGEQIQELPEQWKRRFFRQTADKEFYEVTQELKNEVIFRQFNLMDDFPFRRKMHIILLRNVMIYFDKETKQRLLEKVYDLLEPGGYLFVGKTETIERRSLAFDMVKPSIFRKTEGMR